MNVSSNTTGSPNPMPDSTKGVLNRPFAALRKRSRHLLTADDREYRLQLAIAFGVALGAAVAIVAYLLIALSWRSQPFLGFKLTNSMIVNNAVPSGEFTWEGLRKDRLQARDRLLSITNVNTGQTWALDGDTAAAFANLRQALSTMTFGEVVTVTFSRTDPRTGAARTLSATYPLRAYPDDDFITFFVVPYISGVIVFGIGLALLYFRRTQLGTLSASIIASSLAVYMCGFLDVGTSMTLNRFWYFSGGVAAGALLIFGLVFPTQHRWLYRNPRLLYIPGLFGVALGLAAAIIYRQEVTGNLIAFPLILSTFALAVMMGLQRRRATQKQIRDQATMVLIGLLLALAPGVIWIVSELSPLWNFPFKLEVIMPFLITPIVGIALALLHQAQFDVDRLVSRSLSYGILVVALVVGYFLLTMGASNLLIRNFANDPILVAITLVVVAVLFIPVRQRLQEEIDRIYYRTRQNYRQKSEEFSRKLSQTSGYAPTLRLYRQVLEDTLAPMNITVFLPAPQGDGALVAYGDDKPETDIVFTPDSGVMQVMRATDEPLYLEPGKPLPTELIIDRARLNILKTAVLVKLGKGERLNGLVSISPSRSGRAYTYEELQFVETVSAQLAVAIERAQVIDSLENRLNELNVLSDVGQAVNFAIGFDDLLELISTRTSRLIASPHFYIALYDQAVEQLYFAFYLENDERYPEYEGNPWRLGSDLFSAIVKTRQPRRVDDYSKLTSEGEYTSIYDNDYVKAWMGVPLIAGSNILGAMAVGKSKVEPYTLDQLQIFGNIGSLAATSIEKARLFDEVNVRARQLQALNEISQKLVLAEAGEVEALLNLITASAVEILNAEAGSLLLAADDDTNDMIFRVAIGGTGQDLVGKRLPAGTGLVGEVVRTGKPQIVNDTKKDQRWQGEVSNDANFRTSSILAVPLNAKNRTIGVLEVLNKLDGTVYVKEEEELLTTFAGQAAIAIENARLFQITGSQLTKRLEELEALEKIDFELNRNLDLQRVAEITLKWTVVNTGAVAGAFGMVVKDAVPPVLRVIHTYGYRPDEFPAGAEGKNWPLDKGIVKRVMRTQRADLADTKIDPDYVPSLKGSITQITIPMLAGGEMLAILILETNREPRFNLLDLQFAQRVTEHASIAVSNALLLDQLKFAAETKSEFVGFAAHELKNALTPVKGWVAMLKNPAMFDMMGPEQRTNAIDIIASNADRMQSMIDDMRDIAKSEAGKLEFQMEPISFHHLVVDAFNAYDKQIKDKGQISINDVSPDLPKVLGDQNKLIQVLINLISNAHKYSPEEATIRVWAQVDKNFRTKKGDALGAVLHIGVQDTGIGMKEEDVNRLFKENYFRSDDERAKKEKGVGLGMIITQRIIESHGGTIWVESKLNVGTTFHFVIPLAPNQLLDKVVTGEMPKLEMARDAAGAESHRVPTQIRAALRLDRTTANPNGDGDSAAVESAKPTQSEPASD